MNLFLAIAVSLTVLPTTTIPQAPARLTADPGTAPTIDGIFAPGEWDDAARFDLGGGKFVRLKHDGKHLYIAFNGDGGNIYLEKGEGFHVLHASFSLGWLEFSKLGAGYVRGEEYKWQLTNLQNEAPELVRERMAGYLQANGWVASLIPMGTNQQTEYAISFEKLGIGGPAGSRGQVATPRVMINSIQNLPREQQYRGEDVWIRWPADAVSSDCDRTAGIPRESSGWTCPSGATS